MRRGQHPIEGPAGIMSGSEAAHHSTSRAAAGRPLAANLPVWVLAGAFLGVIVGLVIGNRAAVLHPLGVIYSMMLESVVYPYILSSLIGGVGGLMRARRLVWSRSSVCGL